MINKTRFENEFREISKFGALQGGGLTRLAFSKEEKEAREYLKTLIDEAGLSVKEDSVGNIFARFDKVENPDLAPVSVGSHIDSVPNGGFYDGTLGVMAGLEAIRAIKESGAKLNRPLELIVFACEESSRFKMATVGSKIVAGKLGLDDLHKLKDGNGISLFQAMEEFGCEPSNLKNAVLKDSTYKAYLELHIEQGPVLENKNTPVGIVTGIAAPIRYELTIIGSADHSGATPMNMRKDALVGASEIILKINSLAKEYKTAVATVGYANATPGVMNVIPGKCVLGIDIRDIDEGDLNELDGKIRNSIDEICKTWNLEYELLSLAKDTPVKLDEEIVNLLESLAEELDIKAIKLPSGAGHDAMHMQGIADLVGMIFVPCKDGISHNIKEEINFDDAVKGTTLLAHTMLSLAKQ
ncbi:MAG: M20 family metallo-hydrolase [Campylobacteraceae bacterium]|nr:M20 family metallo-hydrolase [Campylobacteraceae bacterium]